VDGLAGRVARAPRADTVPSVFLSPEWIGAWWRAYGGGHEARCWAARDEQGELVVLAPLYVRRVRLAGLVEARVIGVMGDVGS
jgi:hypothetical protein